MQNNWTFSTILYLKNQQEIIDRAEATLDDLLARVAGVHEEVSCHRRQFACNCPAG